MLEMCAPGGLSCDGSDTSVTLHCNNGPLGGLGDDDDDDDDDDDTMSDDDDDDNTSGMDLNGLTFSFEMTATQGAGGSTGVAAVYTFSYWRDYQNQIKNCDQLVSIEGVATFGAASVTGCPNCNGQIEFDDTTAVDVSASSGNPDACSVVALDEAEANFGTALLSTITNSGYGDFLSIGLMDSASMSTLGLDLAVAGGYSAADMTTAWAEYGLTFSHAGYVKNEIGSLSEGSGLDAVAANAGGTSNWYGYWQIFLNAADNTYTGTDLSGEYGAQAVWVITFNNAE
jgi:hypothetical protein